MNKCDLYYEYFLQRIIFQHFVCFNYPTTVEDVQLVILNNFSTFVITRYYIVMIENDHLKKKHTIFMLFRRKYKVIHLLLIFHVIHDVFIMFKNSLLLCRYE